MRLVLLAALACTAVGCSPIVGATCAPGRCGAGPDAGLDSSRDALLDDDAGLDDAGFDDGGPADATSRDTGTDDPRGSDADLLDADVDGTDAGPLCVLPEVRCASVCVDLATDPENCGACGVSCASGLCDVGRCVGPLAGHVVIVGHDYETSRAAMRLLVGNAVFLARTTPVSVLAYEGDSTTASRRGTDAAVDATAVALGRRWTRTVGAAGTLVGALRAADVLLVYAQARATDATLLSLRALLAAPLDGFLRRGGVVVILETATATNAGTFQILDPSLFDATGVVDLDGTTLSVVAPGDPVALGMPLRYHAERTTVRFDGSGSGGAVVTEPGGSPVVLHWSVLR